MQPKNILALHSSSDLYGASKSFVRSVLGWKAAGHRVMVVISEPGPLSDHLVENGIEVEFMSLGIIRRKYMNISGLFNRGSRMYSAFWKLKKLIKKNSIDVVYSNTIGVLIAGFVAKYLGVRHIWHVREITLSPKWFKSAIGFLLNRLSSLVIVVSGPVRDHWGNQVSKEKIKLIYNGLNPDGYDGINYPLKRELGLDEDVLLLGMVARVNFWKGHVYFLEIFNILRQEFPQLHAVMVGDAYPGYEYIYDEINKFVSENDLTTNVHDLGYRTDINKILSGLDLFVLPSILPDPLPNTVLEGMASSLAVCGTAHGGALEMIEAGVTGEHIPWDNASDAAAKIAVILRDEALRTEMGQAGRQRVLDMFTVEAYQSEMVKVLED
ncbi:glycosyltransferase family 4 protein [Roseivirga misakiensis]|uniref:Glycosyltransferase subfamily 4-like N-terminal domain-containing protein n=1 Tax=Roseivirga misakiensis TaxID=1563681 RepID=A0A1E5T5Y5_9BACT|nr:glycosyltransferase family 4 protein [Roseivirga misakiensis]OEK06758.1 hypothetical protein BFP71_03600 [Roseivirga misakiensis]